MSVKHPPAENGTATDELPSAWSRLPDDDLPHNAVEGFIHEVTGQTVMVRRQRRPTQMHDPMTSSNDTGYRALVEQEHAAPISHDLSDEAIALEKAREFTEKYPDGDFDVPHPKEQPYGGRAVEW